MKSSTQRSTQQLFIGIKFIFLTDTLSRNDVENVSIEVLEHGGNLEIVSCGDQQIRKIDGDYLICDPRLDADEIKLILGERVKFRQILDYSFVQGCVSARKLVPISSFRVRNSFKQQSEPKKRSKFQSQEGQEQTLKKNRQQRQNNRQQQRQNIKQKVSEHKKEGKDESKRSNNKFIIEELNKLLKVYTNDGDKGRKIAYARAIAAIKSLDKELQTQEDVNKLKSTQRHIGDKIVDKIKQLLKTGSINKLEKLKNTDENIALEQITRVWGIGAAKAKQMYQRGVQTIQDLRQQVQKFPDILTKNQKIGLKYVEDLEIRIPRKKVSVMFEVVRQTFYEIVGRKDLHDIQICGSFRRQKQTCGDMDIFITRKDGEYEKNLLTQLIQKLSKKDFLTDHLAMPRNVNNRSCQTYMGICHLKDNLHHRIDIKYYPSQQFAFAVLYFTGSDMFNRKMRLEALQKGYHLSDHGMYKFKKNGKEEEKLANIHCKTEKDIFEALGIKYRQPKDREA